MGVGWIWVCGGYSMHASTCMDVHTHAHKHTCMLNMVNMDASMSVAIYNFCTCIHVCVHVHACAHVWGHPHALRHPPTYLPPPQSHREPKTAKLN